MATALANTGTFVPASVDEQPLATRSGNDRRAGGQGGSLANNNPGNGGAMANANGMNNGGGMVANGYNNGGMAAAEDYSGLFGPIQRTLAQPAVKRALPVLVIALVCLLFAIIFVAMNQPAYRPVMTGVTEGDQQAVFEALKAADYKPIIDSSNGQVTVPTDRYHAARIFLASKGLPKTMPTGLDALKEQSALTTSQFMEQARYNAAMEQELARTILQIETIQNARVHLAITKPSVFVRDRTPPKASVVVTPQSGRTVSPLQVQAMVHLIASSVPLLTPDNVVIVDNFGKLMTESASEQAMGLTAGQTKHKQNQEDLYRQRVLQILSPIVGEANVRSQVNLALDFSQTETTVEDYDTAGKGPKTRSEILSEDRNSSKEAGGVPGTLSNTAPPTPTTSANTQTTTASGTDERNTIASRSTRNYEIDRSVRHTKSATGDIQRLSVAVVINERAPTPQPKNDKGEDVPPVPNPYTPEEIERMTQLVRGVVGFDEARKDVVSVVQAKFEPETPVDLSVPWYKDESIMNSIKVATLGVAFIGFLLIIVRPYVMHTLNKEKEAAAAAAKAIQAEQEAIAAAAQAAIAAEEAAKREALALENPAAAAEEEGNAAETLEEIKAKMKPKKSNISAEMLDTANTYDDKVALIRMVVAEDQGRVASVLKNMIKIG
ncbi:MAG: flagellar M-ring protein FliF [Betaproteobacteria bacterium]|nr:flagellar M-ring protein FliF [Betaproteobacteria bacterium]